MQNSTRTINWRPLLRFIGRALLLVAVVVVSLGVGEYYRPFAAAGYPLRGDIKATVASTVETKRSTVTVLPSPTVELATETPTPDPSPTATIPPMTSEKVECRTAPTKPADIIVAIEPDGTVFANTCHLDIYRTSGQKNPETVDGYSQARTSHQGLYGDWWQFDLTFGPKSDGGYPGIRAMTIKSSNCSTWIGQVYNGNTWVDGEYSYTFCTNPK